MVLRFLRDVIAIADPLSILTAQVIEPNYRRLGSNFYMVSDFQMSGPAYGRTLTYSRFEADNSGSRRLNGSGAKR
jgi:hypothetical protein